MPWTADQLQQPNGDQPNARLRRPIRITQQNELQLALANIPENPTIDKWWGEVLIPIRRPKNIAHIISSQAPWGGWRFVPSL